MEEKMMIMVTKYYEFKQVTNEQHIMYQKFKNKIQYILFF